MEHGEFSYVAAKSGSVLISWRGKQVVVLRSARAAHFLRMLQGTTEDGRQLLMARFTGNFKRGNERRAT